MQAIEHDGEWWLEHLFTGPPLVLFGAVIVAHRADCGNALPDQHLAICKLLRT